MPETSQFRKVKASFLSKVSHELKSPLHGIMSLSDYLHNNWSNVDEQVKKRCISEIAKTSYSLNLLVDSLFNLSKFQDYQIKFDLQKLDFKPLVMQSIDNMGIFIANNENLKIEYQDNLDHRMIEVDQIWFKQLISNILINSIKFTKEGNIRINVTEVKIEDKEYFKFAISDEGIGIPEEELKTIFEEFNRGNRQFDNIISNGLGLAICEEIVKAHKGNIWAHNNNDKGITVEFVIPKI